MRIRRWRRRSSIRTIRRPPPALLAATIAQEKRDRKSSFYEEHVGNLEVALAAGRRPRRCRGRAGGFRRGNGTTSVFPAGADDLWLYHPPQSQTADRLARSDSRLVPVPLLLARSSEDHRQPRHRRQDLSARMVRNPARSDPLPADAVRLVSGPRLYQWRVQILHQHL